MTAVFGRVEVDGLARRVAGEVAELLARQRDGGGSGPLTAEDERAFARALIAEQLDAEARRRLRDKLPPLPAEVDDEVAREAFAHLYGLGRLQRYLDDERVTDIHVQGCDTVWIKHTDGSRHRGDPVADSDEELVELLRTVAARSGRSERRFDPANPELNLHLPDGSRLFAIMAVSARPSIAIRKHQFDLAFLSELRARGTLDHVLEAFLAAAVRARLSIVIGGGVATGKTTLMRALINEVPASERLVTIEDVLELGIERFRDLHPDAVTLEAREANVEQHGAITLEQLVRMGLRMDPDRVFVGEVRGAEVLPMLLAMSQGRDGSMCTVHANHARGVFRRLQVYAKLPPHRLEPEDTALLVANAVDLVVYLDERADRDGRPRRVVTGVLEVRDAVGSEVVVNEVFRAGADGCAHPTGSLNEATLQALDEAGFDRRLLSSGGVTRWA